MHTKGQFAGWGGTRRAVACRKGREFAGLEFDGFLGVPQRVAINKSAGYGVWWNRIGEWLRAIDGEYHDGRAPDVMPNEYHYS